MSYNAYLNREARVITEVYCEAADCHRYIDNRDKTDRQRVNLAKKHTQQTGHSTRVYYEQSLGYSAGGDS